MSMLPSLGKSICDLCEVMLSMYDAVVVAEIQGGGEPTMMRPQERLSIEYADVERRRQESGVVSPASLRYACAQEADFSHQEVELDFGEFLSDGLVLRVGPLSLPVGPDVEADLLELSKLLQYGTQLVLLAKLRHAEPVLLDGQLESLHVLADDGEEVVEEAAEVAKLQDFQRGCRGREQPVGVRLVEVIYGLEDELAQLARRLDSPVATVA